MRLTADQWLSHAEFCRQQAAYWRAMAEDARTPTNRERWLRDADMNAANAENAEKRAAAASEREEYEYDDAP